MIYHSTMEKARAEILNTGETYLIGARIVINAPAKKIFDIVANPYKQQEIDGSGMLRGAVKGPEKLVLGSQFAMNMRWKIAYRIANTVVEYKENELIAWSHLLKNRWRYEFKAIDANTTQVTQWMDGRTARPRIWLKFNRVLQWGPIAIARTLVRLKEMAERE